MEVDTRVAAMRLIISIIEARIEELKSNTDDLMETMLDDEMS